MAKSARNSNIELLRILAMFAIIAGHLVGQSGTFEYTSSLNDFLLLVFSSGSRIAVNVFLLIGVWYMVDAKFSAARIMKMYGQLYLYTSLFTIVALVIDYRAVSLKNLIYGFIPFTGRALWFASSYLCLLIFKPFLDMILQWEKKRIITFSAFFFAFMSGLSTILTTQDGFVVDTVWFAAVYLIIGTIKKYPPQIKWKSVYSLIMFAVGYIGLSIAGYIVRANCIEGILYKTLSRACSIYSNDIKSLPCMLLACLIFHFFITIKPHSNRLINSVSKGTFSVYIIHQVPAFYPVLWSVFFNSEAWLPEHNVLYAIFVTITVFLVCSIIDIPRRKWLEPAFAKTKLFNYITVQIEKIYD